MGADAVAWCCVLRIDAVYADGCELVMRGAVWYWCVMIGVGWYGLLLIGATWCWLVLAGVEWCGWRGVVLMCAE